MGDEASRATFSNGNCFALLLEKFNDYLLQRFAILAEAHIGKGAQGKLAGLVDTRLGTDQPQVDLACSCTVAYFEIGDGHQVLVKLGMKVALSNSSEA